MSPSTALRPRAGEATPWGSLFTRDVATVAVASIIALLITLALVDTPNRVSMTVVNDTNYALTIAVSKPGDDSWLPMMVIGPGEEATKTGVIDQGADWRFHFAGQGRDAGEIAMSREDLDSAGWRFVVPADVVERLEAAGATPPPRATPTPG